MFGIEVQLRPVVNHLGQEPREAALGFLCVLWLQGEDIPLGQRCATCTMQLADKQLWNPTDLIRDQMGRKVKTSQGAWVLDVIFAGTFTPPHRVDSFL